MSKPAKSNNGSSIDLRKRCKGLFCRYFALPIETPEDWDDYDDIRWYLAHENVSVFIEEGVWYLKIKNKCRYLSEKNFECQICDKRPNICRYYKPVNCDFANGDYGYDLCFEDDQQMEVYMGIKFPKKAAKKFG